MVELLILQPLPLPHGLERGAGGQGFLWITGFWRFLHKGPAAGDDRGRSLSVEAVGVTWEGQDKGAQCLRLGRNEAEVDGFKLGERLCRHR